MKKHLGRNPFEKPKSNPHRTKANVRERNEPSILEWLFLHLPSKALMIALKTRLIIKSALECDRTGLKHQPLNKR